MLKIFEISTRIPSFKKVADFVVKSVQDSRYGQGSLSLQLLKLLIGDIAIII